MTLAVLRVTGPPGSGKTLLIVSLTEALRARGHRVASAVRRREGATVVVLSSGGRATLPGTGGGPMSLARLAAAVPGIDPSARILLAEGYDAADDAENAAYPAIALTVAEHPAAPPSGALAVVAREQIERTFARLGPGETNGVVDLVEREVLGVPSDRAPRPSGWRRLIERLRR